MPHTTAYESQTTRQAELPPTGASMQQGYAALGTCAIVEIASFLAMTRCKIAAAKSSHHTGRAIFEAVYIFY